MIYPPAPAGLNWNEHYELADALFAALYAAWRAEGRPLPTIRATPDPKPETKRKHVKTTAREAGKR